MERFSLNVWTTKLAIGSVWLAAVFLTVCGFYNIFPLVEWLAGSDTWNAVVAVPVLVISYMIGAIVIHLSNLAFSLRDNTSELVGFIALSRSNNKVLTLRYEETRHELEFLRAAIPTIIALSISVV
ncbi:hypothetical protein N9850_04185 [Granulosicoccus sp.]|nr:hypothetical protein [Granulosicoccus sp.]MDB4222948.1 hypothetical protein [Granulosicoccus sp.]